MRGVSVLLRRLVIARGMIVKAIIVAGSAEAISVQEQKVATGDKSPYIVISLGGLR